MFLNPRNSVVDVVQSVGRVMRSAEGKKYGYIILPIGIPADVPPEEALKNNEKYKIVWQVLQALRAHDDWFNATVNQIELYKSRPDQIQVIGVGGGDGDTGDGQEHQGGG
jgi:predicted helicase